MNHTCHENPFLIPLLLLVLPLAVGALYVSLGKSMNIKNKYNAGASLLVLLFALSPLQELFPYYPMSLHMLGHILVLLIFPPLFWAAIPEGIVSKALSYITIKKIMTFLSLPLIAYCIGMSVMWIVNIPMLFDQGTHHHHMHHLNTFMFLSLPVDFGMAIILQLFAGLIYSLPAFAPIDSLRLMPLQRVVYLFVSCVGCTILGIFITFNPSHMYTLTRVGGLSLLDIQLSGLIMWVPGCLVYISKCVFILAAFFKDEKLAEIY